MKIKIILSVLVSFTLSAVAQAVSPPPDGGYPGYNTAEGQNALFSRTTGLWNTALGAYTLYADTTGTGNTAVGINGLRNNVRGSFNTALGLNALFADIGDASTGLGCFNTASGAYALFANTDGYSNSALGYGALASNITGGRNTATGMQALQSNTSGGYNTASGVEALQFNRDGVLNTATGASALQTNDHGNFNTATGGGALELNSSGSNNTASGVGALESNSTGSNNTADGSNALFNSNGNGNTAIGDHACFSLGSGDNNVALGSSAGANVTTGSFNVYIGAGITGSEGEVGHTYISNINSTVQPPNGSVEYVTIDLNNRLLGHSSSSQRYKECIKPMNSTSETLYKLKPVTYRYKKEIDSKQSMAFGLIAEEVAKVNPVLIARNAKGQPESVHYEMVNAMLLNEFLKEHKTVQELKYEAAKQEEQIRSLTSALQKINARLETRRSVTKITSNDP